MKLMKIKNYQDKINNAQSEMRIKESKLKFLMETEKEFQEFHLIRKKQMIPGRDPGDGFYIAVFEKES